MDKYIQIRMLQAQGARTIDELQGQIEINNQEEREHIIKILNNACSCHNLSVEEVLEYIKNGADDLDKLSKATKMSTCCGQCKPLALNILETQK